MQRFLFNISILYAYSSVPNKQHYILIDFCKALKYKVFMTHPNALSLAFLEGPDFFCKKRSSVYQQQTNTYIFVAVTSSEILKVMRKSGVTFNFDKQNVTDFTKFSKNDNVPGLRSKFVKVVIDPLFFGQKNHKGLLFISKLKEI